jgi:lipoprotein-releasing system permease protein
MIKRIKTLLRHKSFVYFSAVKTGDLRFENFISRKLLKSELQNKKVSRPIVRISVTSIALAIVVNLITIAVVTGFQKEVSNKVSGFGSHMLIMGNGENSIYECEPIHKDQAFLKGLCKDPGIASVAPVAYKPVLFQSEKKERSIQTKKGDTTYVQQEIIGAVLKGIDENYDLSFFQKHLLKGRLPQFQKATISDEIILSEQIAKDLNLTLNDDVRAFFVKNQPVKRIFKLVGIYRTGLEEFDRKIALGDIRCVQQLNDWGIQARIEVADTLTNGQLIIRAEVSGGNGNFRYDWGEGYEAYAGFTICPTKDTNIRVIVSDFYNDIRGRNEQTSIPDTAYLAIKVSGNKNAPCQFMLEAGMIQKQFTDNTGNIFSIQAGEKSLTFDSKPGKGSFTNYIGGFEITVKNWNHLPELTEDVKRKVAFLPNEHNETLSVSSIQENQADIFVWLGFLDVNVVIILTLMILIGIINMGSALLVMILVRSNFIGLMKAMGATNWSIRKIFLYQAGWLILRGMVIGNVVGLGWCLLQSKLGFMKLDPTVYYLDKVPVSIDLTYILLLNLGTLVVCLSALIIPSMVISRVDPVKSIKFN